MMTQRQIERVMRQQMQVWHGDKKAIEAIVDVCHGLANAMKLTDDEEREEFMQNCGVTRQWHVEQD